MTYRGNFKLGDEYGTGEEFIYNNISQNYYNHWNFPVNDKVFFILKQC